MVCIHTTQLHHAVADEITYPHVAHGVIATVGSPRSVHTLPGVAQGQYPGIDKHVRCGEFGISKGILFHCGCVDNLTLGLIQQVRHVVAGIVRDIGNGFQGIDGAIAIRGSGKGKEASAMAAVANAGGEYISQ